MAEKQPSFWAEVRAMIREGIKDIREAVVERGWFGHAEGPGEPGTPLNPTQMMVTEDLENVHGSERSYQDMLHQASERGVQGQGQDLGR